MAQITSYATLKTAIAGFLGRDPLDGTDIVVANLDLMIQLAEKKFARVLKLKQLMRRANAALNEEAERLPDNLARIISVAYQGVGGEWRSLQFKTPSEYRRMFSVSGGSPYVYTIIGHEILFGPYASSVSDETTSPRVEVVYWATPVPLSDVETTNEVLVEYPEIYLFGALTFASHFIVSDQAPIWQAALAEAVFEANEQTDETIQEGVQASPSDIAP